jgi:hypothetical protein
METEQTTIDLRKDIKTRAFKALSDGKVIGVSTLKGLVEKALDEFLKTVEA